MDIVKRITELREEEGESRKEFLVHTGMSAEIWSILGFSPAPVNVLRPSSTAFPGRPST